MNKQGKTVDFLLTAKRDASAARRFFEKAMQHNDAPDMVTLDKSRANKATIDQTINEKDMRILVPQVKYLNNIVEPDHRAVKRVTKPMMGFKSFRSAQAVLAGVELMHRIRKGQFMMHGCVGILFARQFYMLAGKVRTQ